ncbi:MAG: hypothetical protein IPL03_11370 [Sterolibacteriaceae bacterium]|nr:hypothetical protein [Candidatus Methylophosphatis haderslevensis]
MALACAALALQIHTSFNVGRLFLRDVPAEQLHWWMPAFWIGFNLAMLLPPLLGAWPRRRLACRLAGGWPVSAVPGAFAGGLQAAAGAAWALFLSNAFSTANALGSPQRQGRYAGGVHAVLAGGSVLRLAMASAAVPMALGDAMLWLPAPGHRRGDVAGAGGRASPAGELRRSQSAAISGASATDVAHSMALRLCGVSRLMRPSAPSR